MNTYYDILDISQEATGMEIKKAYFSMVRKYTPERFPEKFMEIRHAYETLSNENMRLEYDEWMNMPLFVRVDLDMAKGMFEQGNYNKAINILEELKQDVPEMLMIQSLLGEAYINNNNPGKAIKVFENLVLVDAENPSFTGNLAQAYLIRGWHKKALNTFKKAIALDKENFWLWSGLSEAYMAGGQIGEARKILQKLLSMDQVKESFAVSIYFRLFLIDMSEGELENMRENLEQLSKIAVVMEEERDGIVWVLLTVANHMANIQVFDVARDILDKAWAIAPYNKEVKELKDKIDTFCNVEDEFSNLEMDDHYDDAFVGLIASKIFPMDGMDDEMYAWTAEYNFLDNFNEHKKYIFMLEKQYPKIYNELKEYFEQVLNPRKRAKKVKENEMFLKGNRELVEMFMFQQLMEDDDEDNVDDWYNQYNGDEKQEPYIRAELKIGRNDPCHCGSGKKYKKCCGR